MMTTILPTIFLESKKKTAAEIRADLPLPLRILTSPKTTLALGATLAALLTGGALAPAATGIALRAAPGVAVKALGKTAKFVAPKTLKGTLAVGLGAPIAVGLLKGSPKAREFVGKTIDPREGIKRGAELAKMIEDPKQLQDQLKKEGLWETIKTGAKKGGKYGAIAAGVLGVAALVKAKAPQKVLEFAKEKLAARKAAKVLEAEKEALQLDPGMRAMGFTEPRPVGIGGIPISQAPGLAPGAPGATLKQAPIQNIIQIQVT